jgi:uncharacterized membrane protein
MVMTRDKLMRLIDTARVEAAIRQAERRTCGQICVSVSRYFWGDVRTAAEKAFARLHVAKTARRNGVLIFVVPSRKKFVVLGDSGIHDKVGAQFWNEIVQGMAERFKKDDFTGGLVLGIEHVGAQLSHHFPFEAASAVNELPDTVDFS